MPNQYDVVLAMGLPGGTEWLVIMVVALLLFGKRLPEIMRGLGSSVRSFRQGMESDVYHQPPPPSAPPPPPAIDGAVSRPADPVTTPSQQPASPRIPER